MSAEGEILEESVWRMKPEIPNLFIYEKSGH